ncbi:hypothetical protein V8F33_010741 [Rhypophila sp. PSN 637]
MNGINGGNMAGAMGFPTPAGHQAELNYIYGMVEELSRQLSQNQRALEEVVSGVGRVRTRARSQSLGNEELIDAAADEVKAQEPNMDALISLLSEALEKAKFSRDANAALLSQYATVLSTMLKQFHEYKAKHVQDVSSWHRSYRAQLAEARAENCRLREQIWEMQSHAGTANEMLRKFRTKFDENEERWDKRVENKAVRQELRFWKRMAMPELPDDDPYWSDDDDLIDWAEKFRLREIARKVEDQKMRDAAAAAAAAANPGAGGGGGDNGSPPSEIMDVGPDMVMMLGGVPMQRDDSGPVLPPRPPSAASSGMGSTGSTGQ